MVPVLVVDKWRMFAEALTAGLALATDIMVVGIAVDVETAVQLAGEMGPVVVVATREYAAALLDAFELEGGDNGAARVIVLAEAGDETDAVDLLRSGCAGWVRRESTVELLVESIRAVARDETALPAALLAHAIRQTTSVQLDSRRARLLAKLTPRQAEIIVLMESGMGRREVAYCLHISPGTVRTHVQRISSRLGVHSAAQAVSLLNRKD